MADELYLGATPVPEDFDVFWDGRMAEADAAELEWELAPSEVPSSDECDFYDLRFTGLRGERLYAKYLRPRSADPVPLVMQFHGYPGASRSWFEQASFAGMGCALIALDNPGQGGLSWDAGSYAGTTVSGHLIEGLDGPVEDLYYVRLYQNLRLLARIVRELDGIDLDRVYVNGASQGGGMGLAFCALNPELVAKATILYPFLSDFRAVYDLGADEIAYEGIRYYSRWFDPDGEREDEWFSKLAYIDTASFAHLVRCPILFGTGLADTVCPPKTQDAVWNNLSCEKERRFYEGKGHEEIEEFDDAIEEYLGCESGPRRVIRFIAEDGRDLKARVIAPAGEGPHPLVMLFHDYERVPRGWHHMTRYLAAGYAVLQLENDVDASPDDFDRAVSDALCAYEAAGWLADVDKNRISVFGEGFGGALALAVAAERPVVAAAAIASYPLGPLMEAAERIDAPVLFGICRMDEVASPADQDAFAARLGNLRLKNYPKYIHERVNAFENELIAFLIDHKTRS